MEHVLPFLLNIPPSEIKLTMRQTESLPQLCCRANHPKKFSPPLPRPRVISLGILSTHQAPLHKKLNQKEILLLLFSIWFRDLRIDTQSVIFRSPTPPPLLLLHSVVLGTCGAGPLVPVSEGVARLLLPSLVGLPRRPTWQLKCCRRGKRPVNGSEGIQ